MQNSEVLQEIVAPLPIESWGLGLFGDCRFLSTPLSPGVSGCGICGDTLVD